MDRLISIVRAIAALPLWVAMAVLFALMVMTFADVVLRSAFNAPIEAAPELTRMAVGIVVFATLPVLSGQGKHISVDLLDSPFARLGLSRWRDIVVTFACGAVLWWPANRVVALAERARSFGDITEYLNWPTFYMAWFIAIMTFATMVALMLRGLALLFAPQLLEPAQ